MVPALDRILSEKFLWCSRESNPGLLGWMSDVLTTIKKRQSCLFVTVYESKKLSIKIKEPISCYNSFSAVKQLFVKNMEY